MLKFGGGILQKKRLRASIIVALSFIFLFLYYIEPKIYLGVYPIGVVAGICTLFQLVMFILTIKDITKIKEKIQLTATLVVNTVSVIFIGFFFIVWLMVI